MASRSEGLLIGNSTSSSSSLGSTLPSTKSPLRIRRRNSSATCSARRRNRTLRSTTGRVCQIAPPCLVDSIPNDLVEVSGQADGRIASVSDDIDARPFSLWRGLPDPTAASPEDQHRHGGRDGPDGRRDADVDETATLAAQHWSDGTWNLTP